MTTGSGNVTVVTEETNATPINNLAVVSDSSSDCCSDINETPTPIVIRHNDLANIQGGDYQDRYHVNLNTYGALIAATEATPANRYATLNDLTSTDYQIPTHENRFITLLDIPSNSTETDPTVPEWVKEITEEEIAKWNNALLTETDPTVPAWVKAITQAEIAEWNIAGTQTFKTINGETITGTGNIVIGADGITYELLVDTDGLVSIETSGMKHVIANKNLTITVLDMPPGSSGTLIVKQDDSGAHITTLGTGNAGSVVLNTLARAITELDWIRTEDGSYFTSRVLDVGLPQTVVPVIRIDDFNNTLTLFTSFADTEILMSVADGPWVQYTGGFAINATDYPAGYWKFKVKEAVGRLESAVTSSLAAHAIPGGFPYVFSFGLSS